MVVDGRDHGATKPLFDGSTNPLEIKTETTPTMPTESVSEKSLPPGAVGWLDDARTIPRFEQDDQRESLGYKK